jgi:ribosome maturation factor RimP
MGARAAAAPRSAASRRPRPAAPAGGNGGAGAARGAVSGGPAPRQALTAEIEAELSGVAAAAGCELIHVEWKGGVLRLVLDRQPGPAASSATAAVATDESSGASGVSLADCEHVAKQASALLDMLDFGKGRYLLEVSSPGLDRKLSGPRDYQRFVGRLARVTFETGGTRRTVVGRLAELRQAPGRPSGELTLIDERTGERLALPLQDIRLARLEVEL